MKTADELKPKEQSALTATAPGLPVPAIRALVERLMVWMPGLSDTEARMALSERAREFCSRTNCWAVPVEFGPVSPFGSWPLACVPGGAVALRVRMPRGLRVHHLWERCAWSGLPGPHPCVFPWPGCPDPFAFWEVTRPAVPVVVLAPEIGGEALPEEVVARWGDGICDGARAHLCAMPNKPWSDPNGAALYGQKWSAALNEARAAFELDGVPPHMQTRAEIPFV